MRSILVPTDFSATARNAISYALQVAIKSNSRLVLYHSMDRSSTLTEEQVVDKLRQLKSELIHSYQMTNDVTYLHKVGKLTDTISAAVREANIDLIIMGTNGASRLMNLTLGSNAASMIDATRCPVLIVPPDIVFRGISKLVLAVDSQMDFLQVPIARLRKVLNILGGNIFVLSVIEKGVENVPRAIMDVQKMHTLLSDVSHSFHYIYCDDVEKALNDFADLHYADVIITLPQRHSWAGKIFNQSHTRQMVKYLKNPVLALQD